MNIPEEIVEKAAQAAYAITSGWRENWDDELPDIKTAFRDEARAALSAAAPSLMAGALREAAEAWETDVSDPTPRSGAYADGWLRKRANELETP